jgi:hypothetical protein
VGEVGALASVGFLAQLLNSCLVMFCREGKAWTGVSGVMGGCEVYRPLMQQLQLLCTACVAAINEVRKPQYFTTSWLSVIIHISSTDTTILSAYQMK